MTDATTQENIGTIEHLDPNQIIIGANIRLVPELDKDDAAFVKSIGELGVISPIKARRDEDGNVVVRFGQRRTLAARMTERPTVPVYVVEGDESTVDRLFEQLAENDHRKDLTDAQRAAAYQQLSFEGLSVSAIAKGTQKKPAQIKQALAVADNPLAASAIQTHDLSLDQAATLIEFEGQEDTVDALIEVATTNPEQFAYAAQRARDDRTRQELVEAARAGLIAKGYAILDREPGYYETEYTRVRDLVNSEGETVTPDMIEALEGRTAFVRAYASGQVEVSYFLPDPKKHGFKKYNTSSNAGPMTDEQKAERKTLIANNKAWVASESVRREFLATLLSRKTLPKDAVAVVAAGLTAERNNVGTAMGKGNELAHQLLGLESGGMWSPDKLAGIVKATPTKAQHVALAVVLGGIESSTSKATWRNPTSRTAAYFAQLAGWGHNLSEVEQIVADALSTAPHETEEEADDNADLDAED
jgi:ParB family chromosome partitioning protein